MALNFNNNGELAVILKVKDDGSLVMEKFGDKTEKAGKKAGGSFDGARKKVNKFGRAVTIAAAAVVAAGTAMARSFIGAASESEQYRIRLNALLGSVREGSRLFDEMADFASRVPFEYREIMESATQLSGVMKGGVDEIRQWMPLIADLAAVSGLSIQETTGQVVRMYSAGAAAADMFRERGILSMLGFKAGVSVSAEETRETLMRAWLDPASQFRDASAELAKTWAGQTSMLSDRWFQFRNKVMDAGLFNYLKSIGTVLQKDISGAMDDGGETARQWSDMMITALEGVAKVVGILANGFQVLYVAVLGVKVIITGFLAGVLTVVELVIRGFNKVVDTAGALGARLKDSWNPATRALGLYLSALGDTHVEIDGIAGVAQELRDQLIASEDDLGKAFDNLVNNLPSEVIAAKIAAIREEFEAMQQRAREAAAAGAPGDNPADRRAELLANANAEIEKITRNHQQRLTDIEREAIEQRAEFERMSTVQRVDFALGEAVRMTQGVATSSKTMFRINKAAAIAQATIAMFQGIEKTRGAYPYPWNIPMVALHIASSLANIAKLKAAQFGTSTSAPSVAGGGAIPVQPVNPVSVPTPLPPPQAAQPRQRRKLVFNFRGESFSAQQLRDEVIPEIVESIDDGAFDTDVVFT